MSVNTHEKPMMTLTIAKKKQVTITKNEEAKVTINSIDDIGRVVGTISYRGIIVGRDTLRNELRLKVPKTNGTISFPFDRIADIQQGDDLNDGEPVKSGS